MAKGLGSVFAFVAGEGNVRMVGSRLGGKAAWSGCGDDGLLKNEERRRRLNVGEEDSCVVEETGGLEADRYARVMNFVETRDDAVVLLLAGAAEKLQGNVPRFGSGPAELVVLGVEAIGQCGEFLDDDRG